MQNRQTSRSSTSAPGHIAFVLAAAMLWGTTGTAQHFAPSDLPAQWIGALRLVMAAAFLALLAWATERDRRHNHGDRQTLVRIAACGLCMAIYNLSFFAGVRLAGVALGTALAIGSGPVWAGFMQAAVQRQWPSALWWLGTCTGVAGGVVMALAASDVRHLPHGGMALCLLAGMSYAAFALINQGLVLRGGAARTNAWVFACAALISLPLAAWWSGPATIGAGGWAVVVYLGVIATGLAYWLFSHGLRGLSAATGVALSKAEPVMAFALAVAVVGERPAWWSVLGLLAVIGGLWLVVKAEMRR